MGARGGALRAVYPGQVTHLERARRPAGLGGAPREPLGLKGREGVAGAWRDLWRGDLLVGALAEGGEGTSHQNRPCRREAADTSPKLAASGAQSLMRAWRMVVGAVRGGGNGPAWLTGAGEESRGVEVSSVPGLVSGPRRGCNLVRPVSLEASGGG